MIALLVLVALVGVGYLTVATARERGAPKRSVSATALRLGAGIAVVRIVIFYGAWSSLGYPDERQAFGYVLIILNSLVELSVGTALYGTRARGLGPPVLVAVLIGLTSVLVAFAWAWLRSRPRSGTAA